jgi:hypothetical protein
VFAIRSDDGGGAGCALAAGTPRIAASAVAQGGDRHPVASPVGVPAAVYAGLPAATTFTTTPAAPLDPAPVAITSGLVIHPLTPQVIYAGPGKQAVAVLPTTELGAPTWVPVIQSSP